MLFKDLPVGAYFFFDNSLPPDELTPIQVFRKVQLPNSILNDEFFKRAGGEFHILIHDSGEVVPTDKNTATSKVHQVSI